MPQRQPGDLERVLNALVNSEYPITHRELCQRLRLGERLVFEIISELDGTRLLLGGDPGLGYQLAAFADDGTRRDRAIASQAREMLQRLRRRKVFARTLPKRPGA
jgi:hypothetical protein